MTTKQNEHIKRPLQFATEQDRKDFEAKHKDVLMTTKQKRNIKKVEITVTKEIANFYNNNTPIICSLLSRANRQKLTVGEKIYFSVNHTLYRKLIDMFGDSVKDMLQ